MKDSEEMSLKLLQRVCVSINRLNNKITDLFQQVDSFEEEKRKLEFRLQRLGVVADKIAEAGKIEDEEAKEQEESTKRQRVIPTVKGKYRKSYEIEGVEYEEEEEEVMETEQERHMRILTEQQKAIIQNQAELLQDQQKELDLQGSKIKKLIEEKKEKQKEKRDEVNVINVEDSEKKIEVEPSTSSRSGAFWPENLFKCDVLEKFIPGYKASQTETTDTTPTPISTSTTQQAQPSVFVLRGT